MNEEADFGRRIITLLERTGIPYIIGGSVASSYHGEPRATHDIDIVIDPTAEQIEALLEATREGYYVSPETARSAIRRRTSFNIIDHATGRKADLICCRERPYSREEFRRRRRATLFGLEAWLLSPEDVILSKLEWARQSRSERQLRDALYVALGVGKDLDLAYLRHWADALRVGKSLEELLDEVSKRTGADTAAARKSASLPAGHEQDTNHGPA